MSLPDKDTFIDLQAGLRQTDPAMTISMETNQHIHLSPQEADQPLEAAAPMEHALRWDSPHDDHVDPPGVTVFLTQPAYARIHVHASSDLNNEVGGILVGQYCREPGTGDRFIVIEKVLPALFTRQSSVHLTFTQDSIVHYHEMIDQRYTGKQILGWYHTHPRMSVFLSDHDTWLHDHFFTEAWQVALVVEPFNCLGGFFIRQKQRELDPDHYFGFYEVNGRLGHSSVHWKNMSQPGTSSHLGTQSHPGKGSE